MSTGSNLLAEYVTENKRLRDELDRMSCQLVSASQLHLTAVEGWRESYLLCETQAEVIRQLQDRLLALEQSGAAPMILPLSEAQHGRH